MPIQYGVLLGLWDSKPFFFFGSFLVFYFFIRDIIYIIYLTKKVAYGGRISIWPWPSFMEFGSGGSLHDCGV